MVPISRSAYGFCHRRVRDGQLFLDTEGSHAPGKLDPVYAVAVAQQVLWRRPKRKRVDDLLSGPPRGRRFGDRKMQDLPPLMRKHHKDKQDAEGDSRHREEINGDQLLHVVIEEHPPDLGWSPAIALRSILANRRGGNLEIEFRQFSSNPWAAPSRIGLSHPADQLDQFPVNRRSPSTSP